MLGLGTIINSALIIVGGLLGFTVGKFLNESIKGTLTIACGVSTLFIGMGGAFEGILSANGSSIESGRGTFIVICMVLGSIVGELLGIDGWFEKFGVWLREKTGSSKDKNFVNGFLTATFTVCIGAMAVVGSIEDGLNGDYSILLTKGILDLIIVMVMTASMGKGAIFSFIPVFVLQGSVTLLARLIKPLLTDTSLANLSMIGSILIFCVGINLVWDRKIKVANMLPAIIFAVAFSFLPINF